MANQQQIPYNEQLTQAQDVIKQHVSTLPDTRSNPGTGTITAHALESWAQEIRRDETPDNPEVLTRYIAVWRDLAYPIGETPKRQAIHTTGEMLEHIDQIGTYLEGLRDRGYHIPTLRGKSGYNRALIIIAATMKRAEELETEVHA